MADVIKVQLFLNKSTIDEVCLVTERSHYVTESIKADNGAIKAGTTTSSDRRGLR